MTYIFSLYTAVIPLILISILTCTACGTTIQQPEESVPKKPIPVEQNEPAPTIPATFKSGDLRVSPLIAMVEDIITVSTVISNVGDEPGIYSAVFTVNGQEIERKSISLNAEESKEVSFQFTGQKSGEHKLGIGESHTVIMVYSWSHCEIRYDKGVIKQESYYYMTGADSHIVFFSPETDIFKIQQIRLCGIVIVDNLNELKERQFTVKVWDGRMNILLWSEDFPWQLFKGSLGWINVDVPDICINNDFIVEFISHSEPFRIEGNKEIYTAIALAWERNESDEIKSGMTVDGSPYTTPDYNWFIRVEGECAKID